MNENKARHALESDWMPEILEAWLCRAGDSREPRARLNAEEVRGSVASPWELRG